MKVMIIVTHLLGTGHLSRALVLAKAFKKAGHAVTLVSGGMPVPHLDVGDVKMVQLPPLRSDGINFTTLLGANSQPASDDYLRNRIDLLTTKLEQFAPDALVTELYPFGRRVLRTEFKAVLEKATCLAMPPLILSSVRDILAPPSKPSKVEDAEAVLKRFYDAVLVHSDPSVTRLEASWPVGDVLRPLLFYSGFVASPVPEHHPARAGEGEVLVTAGGGNVGDILYRTALQAAAKDHKTTWRLLVGGSNAAERCRHLRETAPTNALIEPSRSDFRQMLHHVKASVSLCGYNTALDVLQTGAPAVFVPFDDGKEVEQSLRAEALADLDGIAVLRTAELSDTALLNRIAAVTSAPKRAATSVQFDGADRTVEIVETLRAEKVAR